MPLEPLKSVDTASGTPPHANMAPVPSNEPAEAQAIVRRLDWLFRNTARTPAMQQLRDIVQRYRLGARP